MRSSSPRGATPWKCRLARLRLDDASSRGVQTVRDSGPGGVDGEPSLGVIVGLWGSLQIGSEAMATVRGIVEVDAMRPPQARR